MRLVTIGLALSLACGSAALAQAPSSATRCDAEGIPEVAIAACTRMIESGQLRGEKLADALKIRGDVHYNKGDPEGALEDYDRATRINPRYADAYYNRGNIFDERQEHAKAIAEYTKAIEITPAYEYLTNRARSYQLLKDFGRAIPDYTQAVQIRPEESGSYFSRGNSFAEMGERDAAVGDFRKAVETAQEATHRIAYQARLYHVQGLKEQAEAQYRLALACRDLDEAARKVIQDYLDELLA